MKDVHLLSRVISDKSGHNLFWHCFLFSHRQTLKVRPTELTHSTIGLTEVYMCYCPQVVQYIGNHIFVLNTRYFLRNIDCESNSSLRMAVVDVLLVLICNVMGPCGNNRLWS